MEKDKIRLQILRLERKRDFCKKIHCERVAARYQREIDELKNSREYVAG